MMHLAKAMDFTFGFLIFKITAFFRRIAIFAYLSQLTHQLSFRVGWSNYLLSGFLLYFVLQFERFHVQYTLKEEKFIYVTHSFHLKCFKGDLDLYHQFFQELVYCNSVYQKTIWHKIHQNLSQITYPEKNRKLVVCKAYPVSNDQVKQL